ncbi:DUF6748 domain-containing protein [Benzoatithermus flavus]|uniref:DUF6748 domain-containing protein n=1 Tax=Benzoatithermus flavus TaxID=3108223 RepID=A0ABU8XX42_9PROT
MRHAMARHRRLGLLCVAIAACGLIQAVRAAPEARAGNPDGIAQPALPGKFYRVRPDLRRCVSPLCGGYWVALVNRAATACADGTSRPECYVARIDRGSASAAGAGPIALVRGELRSERFPGFGQLGVLVARQAWRAAGRAPATGTWFGLRDVGIRCIAAPCFSIEARVLNTPDTRLVSGVDLDGVAAGRTDREAGYAALSRKDGLIATGRNVPVAHAGPAGNGVAMVASQFFLPLTP